mmetsp:Transcript_8788/g.35939  ORF Transcript_8788/g.35939 Transcript_8788/m.35939 type:complete len:329 (+) Transcript_8788:4151-5137(+)
MQRVSEDEIPVLLNCFLHRRRAVQVSLLQEVVGSGIVQHLLAASSQPRDVIHPHRTAEKAPHALLQLIQLGAIGAATRVAHDPPRRRGQTILDRDRFALAVLDFDSKILRREKILVDGFILRHPRAPAIRLHPSELVELSLPDPRRRDLHVQIPEHDLGAHLLRRVNRPEKLRAGRRPQQRADERVRQPDRLGGAGLKQGRRHESIGGGLAGLCRVRVPDEGVEPVRVELQHHHVGPLPHDELPRLLGGSLGDVRGADEGDRGARLGVSQHRVGYLGPPYLPLVLVEAYVDDPHPSRRRAERNPIGQRRRRRGHPALPVRRPPLRLLP